LAEPGEPERHQQHADREDGLEAESGDELTAQTGRDDDRQGQRQVGEARMYRAVAEHLLHVQRDVEEHREQ
jgi:hypothetical protein